MYSPIFPPYARLGALEDLVRDAMAMEGSQIAPANASLERIHLLELDSNLLADIISRLSPSDLVNVGRTCRSFGLARNGQRSLTNEVANRLFVSTAAEHEAIALPPGYYGESAIERLLQLLFLRGPLGFGKLIGTGISYSSPPGTSSVTVTTGSRLCTALSNLVMRGGTHFVQFDIAGECAVGVIRPLPGLDGEQLDNFDPAEVDSSDDISRELLAERTERWGVGDVHCCSSDCFDGDCNWSSWSDYHYEDWEGEEGLDGEDGTVGLLLDLDAGTLVVYKNGRRLGVMKDGLSGEYCWFATISGSSTVRIERDTLP